MPGIEFSGPPSSTTYIHAPLALQYGKITFVKVYTYIPSLYYSTTYKDIVRPQYFIRYLWIGHRDNSKTLDISIKLNQYKRFIICPSDFL